MSTDTFKELFLEFRRLDKECHTQNPMVKLDMQSVEDPEPVDDMEILRKRTMNSLERMEKRKRMTTVDAVPLADETHANV